MSALPDPPEAAFAAARRAFPVAAPHALKSALKVAAPYIAAAERERICQLARDDADRIQEGGGDVDALCANTLRHFADLLGGVDALERREPRKVICKNCGNVIDTRSWAMCCGAPR